MALLGISYKANVDDVRESPSLKIIELLEEHQADFQVFDPHILGKSTVRTLDEALDGAVAIILATDHNEFKSIDPQVFQDKNIKVIVDGKNCLDKDKIRELGIIYEGIGR